MIDGVSLYQHRKASDPIRQPTCSHLFHELDKALSSLNPPQASPYSLPREDYPKMATCVAYPAILTGLPAEYRTKYCYRITTWPRLVRDISNIPDTQLWNLPRDADEGEAIRFIMNKLGGKEWLRLSTLVSGVLRGRRGFTWWTSTEFPSSNIMCSAHTMGLLNPEVGGEVIILRCGTNKLENTVSKVPTIIDAFFSHIFHSTLETDSPICGRAISVEEPTHLCLGAEEFLVGDLEVATADIEVHPVNLNSAAVHQVHAEDVYPSLDAYYGSLR